MLKVLLAILMMAAATFAALMLGHAEGPRGRYSAESSGWRQTPPVATEAAGRVEAVPSRELRFQVSYGKLHGEPVSVAVHLGHAGAVGAPVAVLCGPGTGQKPCPAAPADFEVIVQPADVIAVPAQGVGAQALDSVLAALDEGLLYVTVASREFPAGEIRGQLSRGKDKD